MGFRGRGNGRGGYWGFGRVLRGGSSGATRSRGGMVSGRCHYCNKEGHWKNEFLKRKADLQRDSSGGHLAFIGVSGTGKGGTKWIIDSGASRHLSARRDQFEDYINIMPTPITIGNGKESTAIGQGNISLQTPTGTIELVGVLHVPEIGRNLISVASMVDQDFRVEFSKNGCMVSKWNTEKVIGKQDGNIYFLTGLQEVALAGLSQAEDLATPEVWHRRIGHRSLNTQAIAVFSTGQSVRREGGRQWMALSGPVRSFSKLALRPSAKDYKPRRPPLSTMKHVSCQGTRPK